MAKRFDLSAELRADPPNVMAPRKVFEHPRVRDWLRQLLELRGNGFDVSNAYIAAKLTKACRVEGIIHPEAHITTNAVQKYLARS